MWWKVSTLIVLGLLLVAVAAVVWGGARWEASTRTLAARLEATRSPGPVRAYDPHELDGLPGPVQRYFRAVLHDGQPIVVAVSLEQRGSFNMSETGERWKPFTSTERVVTRRPGFLWDARVAALPGLAVRVHDAYVGGEGILRASLAGLLPLVNLRGTPEVARGELMRFLAEAVWFPTALLPSQGVRWRAVDDTSADATLEDGGTTLTMLFQFGRAGLVEAARVEARGRAVADRIVFTPWEGRWSHWETRSGMRIPLAGEVAWLTERGRKPYWRGQVTRLTYEFAR